MCLSAQCTDKRVNAVTPALFERYPDPQSMAKAPVSDLEALVFTTGFYRNKARNLKLCAKDIVNKFSGRVPQTMKELISLNGVGRKTANVVLGNAFGVVSGVVVDTHVFRISKRLGLAASKSTQGVEEELMDILPKKRWIAFSHELILHGRAICKARHPNCKVCPLNSVCLKVGVTL